MNSRNSRAEKPQAAQPTGWPACLRVLAFETLVFAAMGLAIVGTSSMAQAASDKLPEKSYTMAPNAPERQTAQQAFEKTEGCMSCHTQTDEHTMHANPGVVLGCTDCHGGDATVKWNGPE